MLGLTSTYSDRTLKKLLNLRTFSWNRYKRWANYLCSPLTSISHRSKFTQHHQFSCTLELGHLAFWVRSQRNQSFRGLHLGSVCACWSRHTWSSRGNFNGRCSSKGFIITEITQTVTRTSRTGCQNSGWKVGRTVTMHHDTWAESSIVLASFWFSQPSHGIYNILKKAAMS